MIESPVIAAFINKTEQEMDKGPIRATLAIQKLIRDFEFDSVLDVGLGPGKHAKIFEHFGKKVSSCDMVALHNPTYLGDFVDLEDKIPDNSFDCIWASHVLEHQVNVANFLITAKKKLKDDGILAITVPPAKGQIVGGHVTIWNLGLLVYNLVSAGFDCSAGSGARYPAYDISFIVRKKDIGWNDELLKELGLKYSSVSKEGALVADGGDFFKLKPFFPSDTPWVPHGIDQSFNGDLGTLGPW
jgi:SAM-dependent methyltransferase|tara:strand:- start:7719 stop:8447 length:729 start_codon:yes stop_codon:yes gene_type:complete